MFLTGSATGHECAACGTVPCTCVDAEQCGHINVQQHGRAWTSSYTFLVATLQQLEVPPPVSNPGCIAAVTSHNTSLPPWMRLTLCASEVLAGNISHWLPWPGSWSLLCPVRWTPGAATDSQRSIQHGDTQHLPVSGFLERVADDATKGASGGASHVNAPVVYRTEAHEYHSMFASMQRGHVGSAPGAGACSAVVALTLVKAALCLVMFVTPALAVLDLMVLCLMICPCATCAFCFGRSSRPHMHR